VLLRLTGSRDPYPYVADNLLVLPPLTDVLWNTLDVYDRVWSWDKPRPRRELDDFRGCGRALGCALSAWSALRVALALGLGMTLQVLWELGEYASFAAGWSDLQTYGDTIGDFWLYSTVRSAKRGRRARRATAGR